MAHRGSRDIALLFLIMALEGGEGQHHVPAALYPRETASTHFTGGWVGPQGRPGQARKFSPPTGIRCPDCLARSQSLYWLSYPNHLGQGPKPKTLEFEAGKLRSLWFVTFLRTMLLYASAYKMNSPPQSSNFRKIPMQNVFKFVHGHKATSHF